MSESDEGRLSDAEIDIAKRCAERIAKQLNIESRMYLRDEIELSIKETKRALSAPTETAKQQYDRFVDPTEESSPIERLRFFCSLAMKGQDWLDVEPFIDALSAPNAADMSDLVKRLRGMAGMISKGRQLVIDLAIDTLNEAADALSRPVAAELPGVPYKDWGSRRADTLTVLASDYDALRTRASEIIAALTAQGIEARTAYSDALLRLADAEEIIAAKEAQLPDGMKHCTILFKECAKGHGWLTATNWVQHDCPTCTIAAKEAEIAQYVKKLADEQLRADKLDLKVAGLRMASESAESRLAVVEAAAKAVIDECDAPDSDWSPKLGEHIDDLEGALKGVKP